MDSNQKITETLTPYTIVHRVELLPYVSVRCTKPKFNAMTLLQNHT